MNASKSVACLLRIDDIFSNVVPIECIHEFQQFGQFNVSRCDLVNSSIALRPLKWRENHRISP